MKRVFNIIIRRWKAQMPVFFQWIMGIGTSVATIALAIQMALNTGGATIPVWWERIYPYLIGIGAGMSASAKFTQKH